MKRGRHYNHHHNEEHEQNALQEASLRFLWYADVIQTYICPYLTLREQSYLSMATPILYAKMKLKNESLREMRAIWSLKHLSERDKRQTVCKTGLLLCIQHLWFAEHKSSLCASTHYASYAAERGHADVLRFLNGRLNFSKLPAARKYFVYVVCTLIKNNHLNLAYDIYTNANGCWWPLPTQGSVDIFNSEDKYQCWKVAVQCGHCDLDERMAPAFVSPNQMGRLPGTRLLIAADTYNVSVFDLYWTRMADNVQSQAEYGDHAHINLVHQELRRPDNYKRRIMLSHILKCMEKLENVPLHA
jgi:hypothetical protein